MSAIRNIAIAGAGQAGLQTALSLRQEGFEGHIDLIGDEPELPYQRPPLSKKYLAGELPGGRLLVQPQEALARQEITLHAGKRITAIEPDRHKLLLADGGELAYDRLVIATGCRARPLPLPGGDLEGVYHLRSLADANRLRPQLKAGRQLVVIGGGYVGLEVAATARALGLEVIVLEAAERLLARSAGGAVANFIAELHRCKGVDIRLGTQLEAIERDAGGGLIARTDSGAIAADLILTGIGAIPNEELAAAAGLECGGGLAIDAGCSTSAAEILAAGDVTRFRSAKFDCWLRLESVQNAVDQAKAAAQSALGKPVNYDPIPWFWSDQYATKLQMAGIKNGHDQAIIRGKPEDGAFSVAYLADGRLVALDAINRPRDYMLARRLILQGTFDPHRLADPELPLDKALVEASIPAVAT